MLLWSLCSPHVRWSVVLINQWESNSYLCDPLLANGSSNVWSLLSPAMNMFVITIWQTKRADPPEQKHGCQLINEIFNINVEFYQLKRWCWWWCWCWPMTRSGALTGTQMWLMGCEPRQGNEHFLVSPVWQWLELEFSWEQTLENIFVPSSQSSPVH